MLDDFVLLGYIMRMMKFSERFKQLRTKYGMTPTEFGLQFGFVSARSRVWEIENGKFDERSPSNQVLMIFAFLSKYGPFKLKTKQKVKNGKEENRTETQAQVKVRPKVFSES